MRDYPAPLLRDVTDGVGVLPLASPLHQALAGPSWIAKRVEVAPGIVDAQIIHVTPTMVAFLGYEEAPQLVGRYLSEGLAGLADRSSKPPSSQERTPAEVEALICELRRSHPQWGARPAAVRASPSDQGLAQ